MYAQALDSQFARDVRAGLTCAEQKTLPCRYFYDEIGSALFEAIWSGAECSSCRLRHICPDPVAPPPRKSLVHLGHPRRLGH